MASEERLPPDLQQRWHHTGDIAAGCVVVRGSQWKSRHEFITSLCVTILVLHTLLHLSPSSIIWYWHKLWSDALALCPRPKHPFQLKGQWIRKVNPSSYVPFGLWEPYLLTMWSRKKALNTVNTDYLEVSTVKCVCCGWNYTAWVPLFFSIIFWC